MSDHFHTEPACLTCDLRAMWSDGPPPPPDEATMDERRTVHRTIAVALLPWNEEHGAKWSVHDSNRQSEDIIRALDAAGYIITKDRAVAGGGGQG